VEEEKEGREGASPAPARVPAYGPRFVLAAATTPAPSPRHDSAAAAGGGAGSGVNLVKEEEAEEETSAQQRDRLALAWAHGPVRVDSHIKVEDSTSGEDTNGDGNRDGNGEEGPAAGGEGGEGEGEEGPGGQGGLVMVAGAAHVPGANVERGGALRRSTPADLADRVKRARGDDAAADEVPDAPAPKRNQGGRQVGKFGRHGVRELTGKAFSKATPLLNWRAEPCLPGGKLLCLGKFPTTDEASRAYDAEVRRRGWAHVRPLNFPQSEEVAAYAQVGERCDERGLPLPLAPEPPAGTPSADATQGASDQLPPMLSVQKPGKSGFLGVTKNAHKCHEMAPWKVCVFAPGPNKKSYTVGFFATKEEAAKAYDAEVRRGGWTHVKRLNFPNPSDDAALPPSSTAAGAPGPE